MAPFKVSTKNKVANEIKIPYFSSNLMKMLFLRYCDA